MRVNTTAASERTLEDLRNRLSTVSSAMTSELGTMTNRFASTSEEMRQHASRAASEIAAEQGAPARADGTAANRGAGKLREHAACPAGPDQGTRPALRAHRTHGRPARRDPAHGVPTCLHFRSAPAAARRRPARLPRSRPPLRRRWAAGRSDRRGGPAAVQAQHPTAAKAGRSAICWRAHQGTRTVHAHGGGGGGQTAFNLDLAAIARALDTATSAAIWTRLQGRPARRHGALNLQRAGPHVVRRGRHRCRAEPELGRTVGRYLADFERIISESDLRDPSGHRRSPISSPTRAACISSSRTPTAASPEGNQALRPSSGTPTPCRTVKPC